jgi:hypothetical protein
MVNIIIKLILPFILISTVLGVIAISFSELGLNFYIINEIFIFIKSSMKSFDWLIPYQTQLYVLKIFITVELGIFSIKIISFILSFFNKKTSNVK